VTRTFRLINDLRPAARSRPRAGRHDRQASRPRAPPGLAAAPARSRLQGELDFNRWHDVGELQADMRTLENVPEVLNTSRSARRWAGATSRDDRQQPRHGPDTSKPAMYIEANPRQRDPGRRGVLYTIWYSWSTTEDHAITRLVDERAFYIVPTINPTAATTS